MTNYQSVKLSGDKFFKMFYFLHVDYLLLCSSTVEKNNSSSIVLMFTQITTAIHTPETTAL
jgi:hypothetical protein